GGPELVERYLHGGFSSLERAVITAALDARRLGHTRPLSEALLAAAATDYVDIRDGRHIVPADWPTTVLATLSDRDWAKGEVTALRQERVRSGIGLPDGYGPEDYLYQHAIRFRDDQ